MIQKTHPINKTKKSFLFFIQLTYLFLLGLNVSAQIPAGYYDNAEGLTGAELKTALSDIIDNHTVLSYSTLWTAFADTDKKPNGKVWDMYSDVPGGTPPYEFTFGSDQCGNYGGEGDCYNREHSFPRSWFYDASPMESDLFHIVATDGYVNGQRGNFPYGEVGSASYTSQNGSKKGNSNFPGYSGTVFEPIDEYKGDFARGYLYMATRYEYLIDDWNSPMLDGTTFPVFTEWALNLLLQWHEQDPVSSKEIDRNNAIYLWQGNRNPFIDHPEFAGLIWGNQQPPVEFTSLPTTTVNAGSSYLYNISTTGGNGNPITVSYTEKPDWLVFSGGSNGTATLTGTPTEGDQGMHLIELTATDGESNAQQSFNIEVQVTIPEILFISTPVITAIAGQQYAYTIEVTVDGAPSDAVDFTGTIVPTWLNLNDQNNGTALLFGSPTNDDAGPHDVEITATFEEYEAIQSFAIQVNIGGSGALFTETFTLMPADNSSYLNRTWTGDHNIQWNATNARTDQQIDGRALCFRDSGEPYLISETLTGGVMSVSFDHQQKFTGSGGTFTLFINDQQVGEPVSVTTDIASASFNNINIKGDFVIKVVSNGEARVAIDNLSWTNMDEQVGSSTGNFSAPTYSTYPNPFSHQLTLTHSSEIKRIIFINSLGQTVLVKEYPGMQIVTQSLSQGIYLVKIETIDGKLLTRKVFKN